MRGSSARYKGDLTPAEIAVLIAYDPANGTFTWKARSPSQFTSNSFVSPQRAAEIWNRDHAGQPCLARINASGYAMGCVRDRQYAAHRVAWVLTVGEWPIHSLDHIDGDRLNNRIANLRPADAETNARNLGLGVRNTSGFLGVHYSRRYGTWKAIISDKQNRIVLGSFATKAEAVAARVGAERVLGYHANHGKRGSHALRQQGLNASVHTSEIVDAAA